MNTQNNDILSVSNVKWRKYDANEHYIQQLRAELNISDLLARLLSSRTSSIEEAYHFLNPKIKNMLPDPYHLLDMEKAISAAIDAIINKKKICIFGDYDVDGATSSALLKSFFHSINVDAIVYIPDRISEGYGPSINAMDLLKAKGVELLITVDCGTSSFEAIAHAKAIGIDVIVIDHHMSIEHTQDAIAVINPNRLDETSEYKYLAAVGVSFLFLVALSSKLVTTNYKCNLPNLIEFLDLVALGTVCDVMTITKLNRALVAQGLKVMSTRRNTGLKVLFDYLNLNQKLECYHLGFIIGPRINAGGRVGKSELGSMLLSQNVSEELALSYVKELEEYNTQRKLIEETILEQAFSIANEQQNNPVIFVTGYDWHIGVIGIIASRIKDKFNKPAIVVAVNDGIAKASCRSIKGVDLGGQIIEAKNRDLLLYGGGHAMAGGFTATEAQLPLLHTYFNEACKGNVENYLIEYCCYYDLELSIRSINTDLVEEIYKLAPFGNGNHEPIVKISNVFLYKYNILQAKHIQCLLTSNNSKISGIKNVTINAIAFNSVGTSMEEILCNNQPSNGFSVVGIIKLNQWQNNLKIQLQIKDVIL